MNPHDFLEKIDNTIRQYPLICHPFYQAWMQGALTRDDLREYAMEYYNQVAAFPMYLREFARRLPAGELRHRVHQNLCEEEGNGNGPDKRTHATIWMAFAEEVGASLFEIHNRKPLPKTQQLVDLFFELAQAGSEAEALAAFYVYESQVPGLAASKASALRSRYGLREAAYEYFVLHTTAGIRHAQTWREQLVRIVTENPSAVTYALVAADLAAKALWRTLDGINARRIHVA